MATLGPVNPFSSSEMTVAESGQTPPRKAASLPWDAPVSLWIVQVVCLVGELSHNTPDKSQINK